MPSPNDGCPPSTPICPIGDPPAAAPGGTPAPAATGQQQRIWRVYRVRRLTDARSYIGVTRRPLEVRLAVHDHLARRRPRLGGPGTLAEAIRQALADGVPFAAAFEAEVLAVASSADEARRLERDWIAALGTARPHGFNLMPGGSSLGGPANAVPVVVDHPTGGIKYYSSLMDAVADTDRERANLGLPPLNLGAVYARRTMNWPIEEALGLTGHADGRRKRAPFCWQGKAYGTLHDVALASGLSIDAIRSKLHRARAAGCDTGHDMALDRRRPGDHRAGGAGCGRQPPLCLPHPMDRKAGLVDAAAFAGLAGVPKATVLHRYHRFVRAHGPAAWTRQEMLAALTRRVDRTVTVALRLPSRPALRGGVREVVRAVLGDPDLEAGRAERLGASAIRARLRRVPGWPSRMSPEGVRWAFGTCQRL